MKGAAPSQGRPVEAAEPDTDTAGGRLLSVAELRSVLQTADTRSVVVDRPPPNHHVDVRPAHRSSPVESESSDGIVDRRPDAPGRVARGTARALLARLSGTEDLFAPFAERRLRRTG